MHAAHVLLMQVFTPLYAGVYPYDPYAARCLFCLVRAVCCMLHIVCMLLLHAAHCTLYGVRCVRQAHYTEQLVRLPGLSTLFDPPDPPALAPSYRDALLATLKHALPDDVLDEIVGVAGDAAAPPPIFAMPHSLFKLHPSFDEARQLKRVAVAGGVYIAQRRLYRVSHRFRCIGDRRCATVQRPKTTGALPERGHLRSTAVL